EDADDAGGVRGVAVARDRHEIDLARNRQGPHQVGHEEDRALEHADEQQVAAFVVDRDLLAELGDAALQPLLVDQDLRDRVLELGRAHKARSDSTSGCATSPGTAITSSPRTTSGQASRSDLGTFASTNTSWIFRLRPARRSPGRQPRTLSPARSDSMRHSPHSTRPRRSTGPRSSQSRSYSRTACTPPPRSTRREPASASRSSASAAG